MFSKLQPKSKHNNTNGIKYGWANGATLINDKKTIVAFTRKRQSDANIKRESHRQWYFWSGKIPHICIWKRIPNWIWPHTFREHSKSNIAQASLRLQRMLLRLQPFDAKIIYRPGIDMKIPDLSRKQLTQNDEIELDLSIHSVNISAQKQADLQEATEDNEELKMLMQVIINGWPEDVKHIPKPIKKLLVAERMLVSARWISDKRRMLSYT